MKSFILKLLGIDKYIETRVSEEITKEVAFIFEGVLFEAVPNHTKRERDRKKIHKAMNDIIRYMAKQQTYKQAEHHVAKYAEQHVVDTLKKADTIDAIVKAIRDKQLP